MTTELDPKDPEEVIVLTFDFSSELATATLTGSPVVTTSVVTGVDADHADLISGAASLGASDKAVLQGIKAGLANVDYRIKVKCGTNDGRTLVRAAILPVRNA